MADKLKQKAVVIVQKLEEKKMAAKEKTSQEAGQAIAQEVAMTNTLMGTSGQAQPGETFYELLFRLPDRG